MMLYYSGSPGDQLRGRQLQMLNIVDHLGQANIPLKALLKTGPVPASIESNASAGMTVLNDGKTRNHLCVVVAHTQVSGKKISFNPKPTQPTDPVGSKLMVTVPQGAVDWAMAEARELNSMTVEVVDPKGGMSWSGGSPENDTQDKSKSWTFTVQSAGSSSSSSSGGLGLSYGDELQIWLSGIVSGKEDGPSYVVVRYENIPGYWDGELVVPVWKSRIFVNQESLGIGVRDTKSSLDVNGGAVIGGSYAGSESAPSDGLLVEGNVGIGTMSPSQPLEVNGTVQATSFQGSGASLTGLDASNISSGTLAAVRLPATGYRLMDMPQRM